MTIESSSANLPLPGPDNSGPDEVAASYITEGEGFDHPKHYCGFFGIFNHPNAAELTYFGLYALQHRGQESAGIVTCHDGKFFKHHGMGLVPQIFNDPKI